MVKLIILFLGVAILNLQADSTNKYEKITKRNAFDLVGEKPIKILPPVTNTVTGDVYLTGITRINSVRQAHFVVKRPGAKDKFVSLREKEAQDGIQIEKLNSNSVFIKDNGRRRLLSFEKHSLPTIIMKTSTPKLMQRSEKKDDKKSEKKEVKKSSPKASIVKVPSRRPKIDPRIIEKGLEYISRSEDSEKRDYIIKRLESLQSGQLNLKSNIDQNERRRQYDEWRKRRDNK